MLIVTDNEQCPTCVVRNCQGRGADDEKGNYNVHRA
jgi:hypothetical protein